MTVAEKITKHVKALPDEFQAEVLDFVEYLESKAKVVKEDSVEWGGVSLSQAMRGMESEDTPYSTDDLKETFA